MNIKHISFDISKQIFPVSATKIRSDIFTYWNFLPDIVKKDLIIKTVILGTESTGKSTLTERLAKHFDCSFVKEAGRDLIDNSNNFKYEQLKLVASEHAKRIENSISGESPLLIIDTDIHTTISYSKFIFDKQLEVNKRIYNLNKADLYFYLNNDIKFIQDGTRLCVKDRNLLDKSHREILNNHNIELIEIKGNWEERFETTKNIITKFLRKLY